jgi:hypothetical protein
MIIIVTMVSIIIIYYDYNSDYGINNCDDNSNNYENNVNNN